MRSYVTLISTADYVNGAFVLSECLKQVGSKYPLLIMVSRDIAPAVVPILEKNNLDYKLIDNIPSPHSIEYKSFTYWKHTFDKLNMFNLTEFDKIVYIDSDMLVVKNLDHLFDKPNVSSVSAGNLKYGWIGLNGGLIVIKPNYYDYFAMFNLVRDYKELKEIGDQNIISMHFASWNANTELHLDETYNIFFDLSEEYLLPPFNLKREDYKVIHFIGAVKPWNLLEEKGENYLKQYQLINKEIRL